MKYRVWKRPVHGETAIAKTSSGEYLMNGTTGRWTRIRGNADQVRDIILGTFKRCGFKPKTCKVIEVRRPEAPPNEKGAFYLNLGYLRGLDPDEVWRLLNETNLSGKGKPVRRFPDRCGSRKVFEALARLEQRVERPPSMMSAEENSEPAKAAA